MKALAVAVLGLVCLASCSSLPREAFRSEGEFYVTGDEAMAVDVLRLPCGPPLASHDRE